jgi:hypothetical protein
MSDISQLAIMVGGEGVWGSKPVSLHYLAKEEGGGVAFPPLDMAPSLQLSLGRMACTEYILHK